MENSRFSRAKHSQWSLEVDWLRPGSVRGPFGSLTLGSVRGPFGFCSGSVRNPFGVRSGSARGLFGARSRSVRGAYGVHAGSMQGSFGVRSSSVRRPFGVRSESVRAPKRKTLMYYCSQSSARSRCVEVLRAGLAQRSCADIEIGKSAQE